MLKGLLADLIASTTERTLILRGAGDAMIAVEFGDDPDVRVMHQASSEPQPLIAMEIKGGADRSNVHNRLGEAEKSHAKAREQGFEARWTVARGYASLDASKAQTESRSTTAFFDLDDVLKHRSAAQRRFKAHLFDVLGI